MFKLKKEYGEYQLKCVLAHKNMLHIYLRTNYWAFVGIYAPESLPAAKEGYWNRQYNEGLAFFLSNHTIHHRYKVEVLLK